MAATNPDFRNLPDEALLRERQLRPILPFSGVTLWRRCKTGDFPQPIRMPGRITAWRWGEVRNWLESQGKVAA